MKGMISESRFDAGQSEILHAPEHHSCNTCRVLNLLVYDKSSGQSSWLQIRRPGIDSRHYEKKNVVGLERGALSLVSTTEELHDKKVAAPV
jgi:hypothetical protein